MSVSETARTILEASLRELRKEHQSQTDRVAKLKADLAEGEGSIAEFAEAISQLEADLAEGE